MAWRNMQRHCLWTTPIIWKTQGVINNQRPFACRSTVWHYPIYYLKAIAVPQWHSSACRGDCRFCVDLLYHHSLVYPQRCNSKDLQYTLAFEHMLNCYWHLGSQAFLLPCSGKPPIGLLQALGKTGWGMNLSVLLPGQCLSWLWCRTLLSRAVS